MTPYKILLLSVLLLFEVTCQSQDFYVGFRGGYDISSLKADASTSPVTLQKRNAPNVALTYTFTSSSLPLGFTFETGYAVKGTKTNTDSLSYKFQYLTLPLLVDFYPIKRVRISAGPEIAYLMKARNKVNDSTNVNLINTYDKRLEFSGLISASYSISYFADLGVRYNKSFTYASKMDAALDRKNLYNQYFQIFLLLKIGN